MRAVSNARPFIVTLTYEALADDDVPRLLSALYRLDPKIGAAITTDATGNGASLTFVVSARKALAALRQVRELQAFAVASLHRPEVEIVGVVVQPLAERGA